MLLMKDEVGRSKPSARALPGPNFVYGKVEAKDKEGVYERKFQTVTHHWQVHQPTEDTGTEKDFRRMNILSLEQGLVKPKDLSGFRKTADVRVRKAKGQPVRGLKAPDLRFGVPSLPSDSMRGVITNEYGNAAAEQMKEKLQRLPPERPPQSKHQRSTSQPAAKKDESAFKLKRFTAVPARIQTRRD